MEVDIFTLCDFCQADPNGKLTIVGVFDRIWTKNLPAKKTFGIAVRIRFPKDQIGEHEFKIEIKRSEKDNTNISGNFTVNESDANVDYAIANLAFNLNQLNFHQEGAYPVVLTVDGEELKSIPLSLQKVE